MKTWRVSNSGDERWPDGSYLAFTGGTNLASQTIVSVPALNAGEVTDISVNMNSPPDPGMYESKWRMVNPSGSYFGGTCLSHKKLLTFNSLIFVFRKIQFG